MSGDPVHDALEGITAIVTLDDSVDVVPRATSATAARS